MTRLRDQYAIGEFSGRVLVRGCRRVKMASVRINRGRYGGVCLLGRDGEVVELLVMDCYGLEYRVTFSDGKQGDIKYLSGKVAVGGLGEGE